MRTVVRKSISSLLCPCGGRWSHSCPRFAMTVGAPWVFGSPNWPVGVSSFLFDHSFPASSVSSLGSFPGLRTCSLPSSLSRSSHILSRVQLLSLPLTPSSLASPCPRLQSYISASSHRLSFDCLGIHWNSGCLQANSSSSPCPFLSDLFSFFQCHPMFSRHTNSRFWHHILFHSYHLYLVGAGLFLP